MRACAIDCGYGFERAFCVLVRLWLRLALPLCAPLCAFDRDYDCTFDRVCEGVGDNACVCPSACDRMTVRVRLSTAVCVCMILRMLLRA
jgi:hypothetical protein